MSITPKGRISVAHMKFMDAPVKVPLVSWWTDPSLQTDRAAFQRKLIATEITRLNNGSQRFGGSKKTHDKFIGGK